MRLKEREFPSEKNKERRGAKVQKTGFFKEFPAAETLCTLPCRRCR